MPKRIFLLVRRVCGGVGLGLIVLALSLGMVVPQRSYSNVPTPVPMGPVPAKTSLALSKEPRLGEVVQAIFTVTTETDFLEMKVVFKVLGGKIVGGKRMIECGAVNKGTTKLFKVTVRPDSSYFWLGGFARGKGRDKKGEIIFYQLGGRSEVCRILLDPKTGQMGTEGEKYKGVEYHYDPEAGMFLPEIAPPLGPRNKRIIAMMKRLEPAITDSEALCLHSDFYRLGIPPGTGMKKTEVGMAELEVFEEGFQYYLKDGWLKAFREGKREEWIKQESEKTKKLREKRDGKNLNFFRSDGNTYLGNSSTPRSKQVNWTVTLYGKWQFKDHHYNKDQGLLSSADVKSIRQGKARVLVTYYPPPYTTVIRELSPYCVTDDTGGFVINIQVPDMSASVKVYPIIYPSGPNPASPAISVSDPNWGSIPPRYWKDPDDTTLFGMRELGFATPHDLVDTIRFSFERHLWTIWTDTFPQARQPQSGCINIYQTLLQGCNYLVPTYTTGSILGKVRAMWEPGYSGAPGTVYRIPDTIFVTGDTLTDTDEWDDQVLLHEYGHHAMAKCAEMPPSIASTGAWNKSYPADTNLAYREGWPEMFAAIVSDSIYHVNTRNK